MLIDPLDIDYYKKDGNLYILPRFDCIGLFDYLTYCLEYKSIGEQLLYLPIQIKNNDDDEFKGWLESFEKISSELNEKLSVLFGKTMFSVKKNKKSNVLEISLGLYIMYCLRDSLPMEEGKRINDKVFHMLFGGFQGTLIYEDQLGEHLYNFFSSHEEEFYQDARHAMCNPFSEIYLYHKLVDLGLDQTKISEHLDALYLIHIRGNDIYSIEDHERFTKDYLSFYSVSEEVSKHSKHIGSHISMKFEESLLMNLGYILFNEFIIGNECTYIYGEFIALEGNGHVGESSKYIEGVPIIIHSNLLQEFTRRNSSIITITPVIDYLKTECMPFIESIKSLKSLRKSLASRSNVTREQIKKVEEELYGVSQHADKGKITIEMDQKGIRKMESEFTVNDLGKLDEMRKFTEGYGFATPFQHDHHGKHLVVKKQRKI